MTRYTNVALKRTFVEAGFNYREESDNAAASTSQQAVQVSVTDEAHQEPQSGPAKKKRKRSKSRKNIPEQTDGPAVSGGADAVEGAVVDGGNRQDGEKSKNGPTKKTKKSSNKMREARKFATERRRLKRQDNRFVDAICFACREKGHAAKDCPTAMASGEAGEGVRKLGKQTVGICYRCGSKKHTLSRCRTPADPENPLPFSSCFVCSGMGHLASSCPENKNKGVYPNGGCCKLCGETTHLAKDCGLRKNDVSAKAVFLGTGREAGADEDDFHTFKRKTAEVAKEEKADERRKRKADIRVGAHSGVIKPFGQTIQKSKTVVTF